MSENKSVKPPYILKDWAKAVSTLDAEKVLEHYYPGAFLKGTIVDELVHGKDKIRAYFADVFLKDIKSLSCIFNGIKRKCDINDPEGSKHYIGKYTFAIESEAGKKVDVEAIFDFITFFDPKEKRDYIVSHNSHLIKR